MLLMICPGITKDSIMCNFLRKYPKIESISLCDNHNDNFFFFFDNNYKSHQRSSNPPPPLVWTCKKKKKKSHQRGWKNNTPAFSAGQWPSLASKAEKKWTAILNVVVAFSYVISSPSSTLIG
jgi:hypothetical protein